MSNFDDMWDAAPVAQQQELSFDDMWNAAPAPKIASQKQKPLSFDDMWDSVPATPVEPPPLHNAFDTPSHEEGPKRFDLFAGVTDWIDDQPIVKETKQQWQKGLPGVAEQGAELAGGIPSGMTSIADSIDALMMVPGKAIARTFDPIDLGGRDEGVHFGGGLSDFLQPPANLTQSMDTFMDTMRGGPTQLPATAGFGKGIGQFLMPAGGGGAASGFRDAALKGAGLGAATGAVTDLGEQAKAERFDPFELLSGTALGAGFGAAGSTAVHGLSELAKKFFKRRQAPQAMPQTQQPPSPEPTPADFTGSASAQQSADAMFNDIFGGPKSAPPPALPTQAPTVQQPSPPVLPAVEPQGVFRHQRTAFGRNKVDEALPVDQFDDEVQAAVNEIAQHKAILDGHKALMNAYAQKVWEKLQGEGKVGETGTYKGLTRQESRRSGRLPAHQEAELAKFRESLAHDVDKSTAKQHVATVLGSNYGVEGPHGLKMPPLELAETPEQAIQTLKKMKASMNDVQKSYDEAKKRYQPTLERAQAKQRETEPTASFNARTKVKTPFGDDVDAAVSLDHNAMRLKLTKEAEQVYEAAKSEKTQQAALDRNKVPKFEFDVKLARKALGILTGAYLVSGQAAQAADGSEEQKQDKSGWATARLIGEVTVGAALIYAFAPEKARQLLNNRRFVAGAALYKDTLERLKAYDALTGRTLARKIELVGGQSQARNFGVHFDDAEKVFNASEALRNLKPEDLKNLTANPTALKLTQQQRQVLADAFKGLNQQQRDAIIFNEQARRNLGSALAKELAHAEEMVTRMEAKAKARKLDPKLATAKLRDSVQALKYMSESVNGRGSSHPLEEWYGKRLANFMQYNFFLNPAFEATNLTDMFISGASSTGLGNLGKSLRLLGPNGDADLKKLYQNSNLAGGLEAIKQEAAHMGGIAPKKPLVDFPVKSDKINADRVSLAAHLQYANTQIALHKATKGAQGYAGTDVQFVKDLFAGRLDPSLGYDAWAHHFQTLSRSLGVDNFRVNTDFISSHPAGRYIGVLMRQPARIANLQMKYIANEEWGKLFTMMGAVAVFGGRAVVPKEVEVAWQNVDAESFFLAASIIDKAELLRYVTGKSLNEKVKSAVLPLTSAARDPIGGALVKSFDDVKDFMQQPNKDKVRGFLTAIAQLYIPVVKNIPSRLGINAFKNADEAFFSGMPIYFFDAQGKNFGSKVVVKPDSIGVSSKVHGTVGQFIPGEWSNADQIQQQRLEAARRKKSPLRFLGIEDSGKQYYDSGRTPSFLGQLGLE